jgi:Flp pilus assembly protein TadD
MSAHLPAAPPWVRGAFLRGSLGLGAPVPSGRGPAAPHFRNVTVARPDFAAAHSGLAESLIWANDFDAAAASARTALALDSRDARAHRALGTALLVSDWDWDRAERHLRRSVALSPESEEGRVALAYLLVAAGRADAARAQLDAAAELEPVSPVITGDIGTLYLWIGDAERALELCERTVEIEPSASWGRACARRAAAKLGRGTVPAAADPDDAGTAYGRAIALTERGRYREALDALEASADRREMGFVALRALPAFEPLRSHARFEALERRLFGGD